VRTAEGEAALVMRRTEFGESDLILSLYCRSLGKLSALARAGRRSRKRFGAALGLFTLSEVSLSAKPKAEMWTLVSAQPRKSYTSIAHDVTSMAHGSYGTELVRELCADEHPDPEVFDLLLELYESLERAGPKAGRLRVFEMRLLEALGLAPIISECARCGQRESREGAYLDPKRGGVMCAKCSPDATGYGVRPISEAAILVLERAQSFRRLEEGDALDGLADAPIARGAMLALLYGHVGKPLKSVEFIAKLSKQR
jgi:DNA repair protein RecO (recombination protein O)